jgi:peptidoglycan/LPS O-acetylase OafA/YrhL
VEEQFYLIWPFLVLGLKSRIQVLKYVLLLIIILCYLQIYFCIFPGLAPYNVVSLMPRANSLGVGALGAVLYKQGKLNGSIFRSIYAEFAGYLLLIVCLVIPFPLKYLLLPFISLFIIIKCVEDAISIAPINTLLSNKRIIYLGSISYGIYLFHLPIAFYFTKYIFDLFWLKVPWNSFGTFAKLQYNSWLIKLPLFGFLSVMVARISNTYLEKPILSLKDRWFSYER